MTFPAGHAVVKTAHIENIKFVRVNGLHGDLAILQFKLLAIWRAAVAAADCRYRRTRTRQGRTNFAGQPTTRILNS